MRNIYILQHDIYINISIANITAIYATALYILTDMRRYIYCMALCDMDRRHIYMRCRNICGSALICDIYIILYNICCHATIRRRYIYI